MPAVDLQDLATRFDAACRALGYGSDPLDFGRVHPVLHFDHDMARRSLWRRAAACTDCVDFGTALRSTESRGHIPRVAYPLPNLERAAKRAMGCEVKHVSYDGDNGLFLATGLVEGEWRVWAAGLPDLRIKGYATEVEALVAVLEAAAAAKVQPA
jgi:hypothetical protein